MTLKHNNLLNLIIGCLYVSFLDYMFRSFLWSSSGP